MIRKPLADVFGETGEARARGMMKHAREADERPLRDEDNGLGWIGIDERQTSRLCQERGVMFCTCGEAEELRNVKSR